MTGEVLGYKNDRPIILTRLEGQHSIIDECPLCGEEHWHGRDEGPPSHRVAHCPQGTPGADKGYYITSHADLEVGES